MKELIFRKTEQTSINWSGGTSTQLAIYPENTSFAERNFLFRLSTATIEIEKSTFTNFGDIQRILMILEGKITLTQKGKEPFSLSDYQCVSFPGDLPTECEGTARDFNLMLREGSTGSVSDKTIAAGNKIELQSENKCDFFSLYVHKGSIAFEGTAGKVSLNTDDIYLLENRNSALTIEVTALENANVIVSEIKLN